jgi:acetyl esterase/lipase
MLEVLFFIAILALALWAFSLALWALARFYLAGPDLSAYDEPVSEPMIAESQVSAAHEGTVEFIRSKGLAGTGAGRGGVQNIRDAHAAALPRFPYEADITPVDVAGVPGEWVLATGADPQRRLLYLHGGAFVLGSPETHRGITSALSREAGAAVLAIDYRLRPEHPHSAIIDDCQNAYRWILGHGPNGESQVDTLFIAGDSAGGMLTLMLIAWARDEGLRPANAAAALSPGTDTTGGSPSMRRNVDTDPYLGPGLGKIARMPRMLTLLLQWVMLRRRPCNPMVSPIFGNLAGLPPLLIQASEAEMLIDDCRRYANKAIASGSPVTLQTWPKLVHVWQMFGQPESDDALRRIGVFLTAGFDEL